MAVINDRRGSARGRSRRQTPRLWLTRNVQIHISQLHPASHAAQPLILMGYTYDLSATGLSVFLPALDCNIQELFDDGDSLDIVLSTTPRQVKVKATPIHCEAEVPGLMDKSACIGMRIDQQDSGYPNYVEYLHEFQ